MGTICRKRPISLRGVIIFTLVLCLAGLLSNASECWGDHDPMLKPLNLKPITVDPAQVTRALCEPSAMLVSPWNPDQILVGDNEAKGQLYLFRLTPEGLAFQSVLDISQQNEVSDIEALVKVEDGVLVVGSHSRNNACEIKPDRLRLLWLKRKADGGFDTHLIQSADDNSNRLERITEEAHVCVAELFTSPAPPHAAAVCEALKMAKTAQKCPTFNIEGAVSTLEGRIWFGLRAPLVHAQAVMLRLENEPIKKITEVRFDRVVLLDLHERGVRELALSPDGQRIWGLAGPQLDSMVSFRLWHIPVVGLESETTLNPQIDPRCLPTSSEGMLIQSNHAIVVIDGEEDKSNKKACKTSGQQYMLPLHP